VKLQYDKLTLAYESAVTAPYISISLPSEMADDGGHSKHEKSETEASALLRT
jgi:hypothetical protein